MSSFTKAEGSKIAIKFTQDLVGDVTGNVGAFTVTGDEYKYIKGPLIEGDYQIDTVTRKSGTDDTIILTMKDLKRFPTVEGKLTINYDASKGDLEGDGGVVETFEVDFTPEGLEQEPNPHIEETVTAKPEVSIVLSWLEYFDAYEDEGDTVTVAPASVSVTLTDVEIVDP